MIESLVSLRDKFTSSEPGLARFDDGDPRKLNNLSLEQQKKRAKELLRDWRANPPEPGREYKLSDVQHEIAHGYGFRNWAALKAHIEQAKVARDAITSGEPTALDGEQRCLHIRCGNDIQHALVVAGFVGDFLLFPDPYVHGPVPMTESLQEFIEIRARYISSDNQPPYEVVLNDLTNNYASLEKAREYDAVYLWFEHDPYDQLLVAKLLDFFSDPQKRPAVLRMINITHFPGVEIFNGIGQLPAEAMRVLWREFRDVTAQQLAIGRQAWAALRSPTQQPLLDIIATGTSALPTMAIALHRHLQQLPWTTNGLNLSEQLSLQILEDEGDMNAARLFGWYTNHYEPLTFMGDSGYWHLLEDLASANQPAILLDKQGDKPNSWQVSLTDTGRALLNNNADWLELNTVDRWVGGIHIDTANGQVERYQPG